MSEKNGKVGFGTLVRDAFRAPFEERRARSISARVEIAESEQYEGVIGEAAKWIYPEDDKGWSVISSNGTGSQSNGKPLELRAQARKASYQSPLIVGFLKSLLRFVIGPGAMYSSVLEDESKAESINEVWEKWGKVVRWPEIEKEIPNRTWRDGECFIHRQKSDPASDPMTGNQVAFNSKQQMTLNRAKAGPLLMPKKPFLSIRLLDPEHITDPTGAFTDGIVTDPQDVETVIGYIYCPTGVINDMTFIPAQDILHIKIRVDRNTKRGRSLLEPLLPLNTKYEQWLHYRIVLSKVRTAIAWVKTVKGPAAQRSTIRSNRNTQRSGIDVARGEDRAQVPRGGTMVTAAPGVDYDFKNPNLQAADAANDGREIKLNISASTGLPEYMITGDASNANYASTMVAESPGVREFEYWQDVFGEYFGYVWSWVMLAAIEFGVLQGVTEEEVGPGMVKVSYPPLISRDKLKDAQSNAIKSGSGVLSKESWSEEDGRDWETEKERIEAEAEESIGLGVPNIDDFSAGEG